MTYDFSVLQGKKILFLGGEALMCQIVDTAKELGLRTVVTDYHTDMQLSPAKLVADEYWNISWTAFDELERTCKEQKIDGVFAAFSEFRIDAARTLCDRLGLPFYAEAEQIEITRNKEKFKKVCRAYDIPTVKEYKLTADLPKEQVDQLQYPVVIKPADNAGSRGISVVYDESELRDAVEKALSFSKSQTMVVEQYMECPEITASYTIQDGIVSLTSVSDACAGSQKHGQVKLTDGWIFPSRYLKEFIDSVDQKLKEMIRDIGIQNGLLFIMAFYNKGVFQIFEAGYRVAGGTIYHLISYNNEINFLKMMMAYSVTGKMLGWDVMEYDDPFFKHPCCNLVIMAKPGEIGSVGDIEKIFQIPGVLSLGQYYQVGQVIPDSGALSQAFARVNIVADSAEELADKIQEIYQIVDLRDTEGNDMIISRIDRNFIARYWEKD